MATKFFEHVAFAGEPSLFSTSMKNIKLFRLNHIENVLYDIFTCSGESSLISVTCWFSLHINYI